MIPVFISRPNPFTDEQEYFLKKITEKVIVCKFSGVTLEAADFNIFDSLSCLDEALLRNCCYRIRTELYSKRNLKERSSR